MLRFLIQSQDNLAGITSLSIVIQILLIAIIFMFYIFVPLIILMIEILEKKKFIIDHFIDDFKSFYIETTLMKILIMSILSIIIILLCISSIHHNIFTLC